jgi:transposase
VARFGVGLSTINRWIACRRAGELTPQPPGRPSTISRQDYADLWAQLEANPRATLEMQARLWNASHQVSASPWIIGRAIHRLGWVRRKRRWVPPCPTDRAAETRGSRISVPG